MAFGDGDHDEELRDAWHDFCDRLKAAGDLVFKDTNAPHPLQRADGFRFLTQNLGQAFDLALETKDTRYPVIHPFCGPDRKLGGDNADFVYLQAWIDGESVYKISGHRGTARFINFTVQGPRPEKDVYYGADHPNLHEPFGDVPEANLLGDDLVTEWDGSFVLYIGGPERGPNWLPTTPGSRKLFLRQGFDSWDEEAAAFRIERIDMDEPRPVPTPRGRRGVDALGRRLPRRGDAGLARPRARDRLALRGGRVQRVPGQPLRRDRGGAGRASRALHRHDAVEAGRRRGADPGVRRLRRASGCSRTWAPSGTAWTTCTGP